MPRLILVILLIAIVAALIYRIRNPGKTLAKQDLLKLAAAVLLGLVLLLVVTGRMHWLTALVAALFAGARGMLPWVLRFFPMLQQWYRRHRVKQQMGKAGTADEALGQSTVSTAMFDMHLNHQNGHMFGEVTKGPYCGRQLDDMDQRELQQLYQQCAALDDDSRAVLESYLVRRFGDQWQQQSNTAGSTAEMSRQEALDILGLKEGASREDIIRAHRSMMQKVHPDRGGSDFLAAKVNAAKDVLIA